MNKSRYQLEKKASGKARMYPMATVAYYGTNDQRASKAAIGIFLAEKQEPDILERFYSDDADVRFDENICSEILRLLESHNIRSVAMLDRIIGCPHEEGTDYPKGECCPRCTYWAGRDRWTHDRIH